MSTKKPVSKSATKTVVTTPLAVSSGNLPEGTQLSVDALNKIGIDMRLTKADILEYLENEAKDNIAKEKKALVAEYTSLVETSITPFLVECVESTEKILESIPEYQAFVSSLNNLVQSLELANQQETNSLQPSIMHLGDYNSRMIAEQLGYAFRAEESSRAVVDTKSLAKVSATSLYVNCGPSRSVCNKSKMTDLNNAYNSYMHQVGYSTPEPFGQKSFEAWLTRTDMHSVQLTVQSMPLLGLRDIACAILAKNKFDFSRRKIPNFVEDIAPKLFDIYSRYQVVQNHEHQMANNTKAAKLNLIKLMLSSSKEGQTLINFLDSRARVLPALTKGE